MFESEFQIGNSGRVYSVPRPDRPARNRNLGQKSSTQEFCREPAETPCPVNRLLISEALNSYKIIYSGFSKILK